MSSANDRKSLRCGERVSLFYRAREAPRLSLLHPLTFLLVGWEISWRKHWGAWRYRKKAHKIRKAPRRASKALYIISPVIGAYLIYLHMVAFVKRVLVLSSRWGVLGQAYTLWSETQCS
jgi:hypothetical protein